jgi:hypothetical protein
VAPVGLRGDIWNSFTFKVTISAGTEAIPVYVPVVVTNVYEQNFVSNG